jgi:LAS superfamily LD-carboxypeptidase LdcB
VQVEVALGGVHATARAVLDADLLMPASPATHGLHPTLDRAVDILVESGRGDIHVVAGLRNHEEQEELWRTALTRYGRADRADDWVARPGTSMHEKGLAVDLGGDLDLAAALVDELGLPLHRPLGNEPWHFELIGSRSSNAV